MHSKRILALCRTYYQLIVVIQIKRKYYNFDEIYLLLTDESSGYEEVYKSLKRENIFKEIYLLKKDDVVKGFGCHTKILYKYYEIFGAKYFWFLDKFVFDFFLFYNFDFITQIIYAEITKKNKNIICNQYEEGLITYKTAENHYRKWNDKPSKIEKMIRCIRRFLNKPVFEENIKYFLCFYPQIYYGDLEAREISKIELNDLELIEILKRVFNIHPEELDYHQKYIYFASLIDTIGGGHSDGELELIKKIADMVGVENLLVKAHPRDDINRFVNKGFTIDKNWNKPFEIIQLIMGFSQNIFITAMSGVVLTISSVVNGAPKVVFIYNCYEGITDETFKYWIKQYDLLLEKLKKENILEDIYVAKNLEELKKL